MHLLRGLTISIVDPEWLHLDPDPTFQLFMSFRILPFKLGQPNNWQIFNVFKSIFLLLVPIGKSKSIRYILFQNESCSPGHLPDYTLSKYLGTLNTAISRSFQIVSFWTWTKQWTQATQNYELWQWVQRWNSRHQFNNDSSLLFHVIHLPFYWRSRISSLTWWMEAA